MHIDFDDLKDFDAQAVRASADVVRRISADDLARPTPCAGWTLGDLLAHMTAQHRGFAAAARGQGADLDFWRAAEPHPAAAADYADSAAAVIAAFAAVPSPEQDFTLPEFTRATVFPARSAIGFHFIDYVVHAWDVARTLGLTPPPLPPAALAAALRIAEAVPNGDERLAPGAAFAPGLPVEDDIPPLDRILRLLGRAPDWSPRV